MSALDQLLLAIIGISLSAVPVLSWVAALLSATRAGQAEALPRASGAAGTGLVLAAVAVALSPFAGLHAPEVVTALAEGRFSYGLGLRLDTPALVMVALVSFIGWVIARYSQRYLDGEPRRGRYVAALLATLGAVNLLVVANDLRVMALAWITTSLALHQLLTFYPDRPAAMLAAHKKFLVSRLADLALLGGLALIWRAVGSLRLDLIHLELSRLEHLPPGLELATVLLVLGAAMKSAQLPFHGWLTQVMEAPTPVSALLHAGVVNIGGYLMIRLAPLLALSSTAQDLLLGIGLVTTAAAALIMTTRVSVKVMLAWSTIAQMGFMLVECALGAYDLALLHIVGHSLYKAHAFLSSGTVVERRQPMSLAPHEPAPRVHWWLAAGLGGIGLVAALAGVGRLDLVADPRDLLFAGILAFAVSRLLVQSRWAGGRPRFAYVLAATLVSGAYLAAHEGTAALVPRPTPASLAGVVAALVVFAGLHFVQIAVLAQPRGRLAQALHPWLFAGLYLDEVFTRLTFRLWPPRLPARTRHPEALLVRVRGELR